MSELIAALARGAVLLQEPIHGSGGAKILAFIEQSGLNGSRGAILKACGVEHGAYYFTLFHIQRTSRRRAKNHRRGQRRAEDGLAIKRSSRHPESLAGGLDADRGNQLMHGVHQGLSSGSVVGIGHPNSAPTFF